MSLHTERPNSTEENQGDAWLREDGIQFTLHISVNDDSDATYIDNTSFPQKWCRLGITTVDIPSGSRLLQYRARARLAAPAAVSNGRIEYEPKGPHLRSSDTYSKSSSTPSEIRTPWIKPATIVTAPAAAINDGTWNVKIINSATVEVYEGYVDFDVRAQPVLSDFVLEAVDYLPPPDPPTYAVVACGSTITDTSIVAVRATSEYGYSGAPNTTYTRHQQGRLFTIAQTATTGFNPWINGVWGPPVQELIFIHDGDAQGTEQLAAFGTGFKAILSPLPNDSYRFYMRIGTADFISINGAVWWADQLSCNFTIDVPVPLSPTIDATAESCPPSVAVDITHIPPSGGSSEWTDTDDVRVQLQVSWDGGDFVDVYSPDNGALLAESDTITIDDRFVQTSTTLAGPCAAPTVITHTAIYRARLYGRFGDFPGAFVFTDWATADPITVPRCTDPATCTTYLIHPDDPTLNWSGAEGDQTYTTTRPFAVSQPVSGGYPIAVSGAPGGRNWLLRLIALGTPDLVDLETTLAAPVLWYIPDDPVLPNTWVSPGADTSILPGKVGTASGPVWELLVPVVQTGAPARTLPEIDPTQE